MTAAGYALEPRVRAARIAVFGGSSLALAATAHLIGGGSLPSAGVLLIAATLLGLIALPLTARRVRLGLLLPVLVVQQLLLHELFAAAGPGAAAMCATGTPGTVGAHPAGIAHHALMACTSGGAPMADSVPGGPMLLGHLLAVLGTAWLLARGESWLWRMANRITRAAGPLLHGLLRPPVPATCPVRTVTVRRRPFAPLPARGPPA